MRWRGRRVSANVEDRRSSGGRRPGRRVAAGGCGTIVLVLVISMLTGTDPLQLLQLVGTQGPEPTSPGASAPSLDQARQDELAQFVGVVLADTEDTWGRVFPELLGRQYQQPQLVLFSDQVRSACGMSSAAVGPFYCPGDRKVYIDLGFFDELDRRFGAPGDFAQAYVVAHEVGHHLQTLLGISQQVTEQQRRMSQAQANQLSVRLELQADCLAGVWGHHAKRRNLLEEGDVQEGMGAAAAIGDDRLQRRSSGWVQPESWTHGSSEQRQRWLRLGLETGDPNRCDTFQTDRL